MGRWVEPFDYANGDLNGKDGWLAGTTAARAIQVTAGRVTPQAGATGNSHNQSMLPGISWTRPWQIIMAVRTQTQPVGSCELAIEFGLDHPFDISFLRGTDATPTGTLRIDIEDDGGLIPTASPPITDNTSYLFILTYNTGKVTGTLDGIDLFGGPIAFTPLGTTADVRISFLNPSTTPTILLDSLAILYTP